MSADGNYRVEVSVEPGECHVQKSNIMNLMTNLTESSANLANVESQIRDADMPTVMMEFVKLQILNQSGTSMLSQANQLPQSVLSLLQKVF